MMEQHKMLHKLMFHEAALFQFTQPTPKNTATLDK
jgi:hypothetical protein